jgi:YidC/Oxa1 family membrane protein insertase
LAEKLFGGGNELLINHNFLGFDLFGVPSEGPFHLILIPVLAAILTWLSIWLSQKWSGVEQQPNMKFMFIVMPAMTFFFSYTFSVGIGLYWAAGSSFAIGQDYFLTKRYKKMLDAEDAKKAEFEAKKKAAEAAMKEELRQRKAEEIASGKRKNTTYKLKQKPNQGKKKK